MNMPLTFVHPEPSFLENGSFEFWGEESQSETRVRCLVSASAFAVIRKSGASVDPAEILPIVTPIAARLYGVSREKELVFIGMSTFQAAPEARRFSKGRRKTAGSPAQPPS